MPRTASRWRRPLRAAAALALLATCLLLLLALADLGPLLRAGIDRRLPALAADLGLRVDLGPVHLRAWPSLRIEAGELAIRPLQADPKAAPLFSVRTLRADLALWPLLRAGHLHVRDLRVEAPVLRLARGADGKWEGEDALARLQALKGRREPPSPAEIEALAHLAVDRAVLEGGAVLLPALPVREVRLVLQGVHPGAPFTVEAGAALQGDAARGDVQLSLDLGPLQVSAADGALSAPPRQATLRLKELRIAPLLALFLQEPGPGDAGRLALSGARLSGELGVRPVGLMEIEVHGALEAQGMTLRLQAGLRPLPLPVLQVEELRLQAQGRTLDASGSSLHLAQVPPRCRLRLRTVGVDLQAIGALIGPRRSGGPADLDADLALPELGRIAAALADAFLRGARDP